MKGIQQAGLTTGTSLLQGQQLPGYLSGLPGGITQSALSSDIQEGLRQLNPSFQQMGILNSGNAADISARFGAQEALGAQQFNLQNLMQLLNIGVGGQAVPQASTLTTSGQLGSQLAGLRSFQGSSNGTTTNMSNPFAQSFGQAAGSAYGNPFNSFNVFGSGYSSMRGY